LGPNNNAYLEDSRELSSIAAVTSLATALAATVLAGDEVTAHQIAQKLRELTAGGAASAVEHGRQADYISAMVQAVELAATAGWSRRMRWLQRLERLARRFVVPVLGDREAADDLEGVELAASLHAARLE
jgi:hypothetical protein